jgi:hypothetical protein
MLKLNIQQIREIYEYARRGTSVDTKHIQDLCADWLEMNGEKEARSALMVDEVLSTKFRYGDKWRDQPETYWLARLVEEIGELAGAMVGDHPDPVDHELVQIASIGLNWLEMRAKRKMDQFFQLGNKWRQ